MMTNSLIYGIILIFTGLSVISRDYSSFHGIKTEVHGIPLQSANKYQADAGFPLYFFKIERDMMTDSLIYGIILIFTGLSVISRNYSSFHGIKTEVHGIPT